MLISLITSTIGRPEHLRRLLDSLQDIQNPGLLELVLVDQTDDCASAAFAQSADLPFPVRTTTSSRGLSHGRNVGLALARGRFVAFPDDDCYYAPDSITQAARLLGNSDLAAISGVLRTPDGESAMLRWPTSAQDVTRANFYRTALSSTLFIQRDVLDKVGGFDETLGAGSKRGYLSGEESDVVLKVLAAGGRIRFDPSLVVYVEPMGLPPTGYTEKMAGYGRGFGRLFRQHGLSRARFEFLLARKRAGACVRQMTGARELAQADWAFVRGARDGYRAWR